MKLLKLFNFRKKKQQTLKNTLGQNLDKLIGGELPWGWTAYFKDFYQPRNDKMIELAMKTKCQNNNERISALKELISYFYSYKAECAEKGECFEKYFDDFWMHCHNSSDSDFVYIEPYEEELARLQSQV